MTGKLWAYILTKSTIQIGPSLRVVLEGRSYRLPEMWCYIDPSMQSSRPVTFAARSNSSLKHLVMLISIFFFFCLLYFVLDTVYAKHSWWSFVAQGRGIELCIVYSVLVPRTHPDVGFRLLIGLFAANLSLVSTQKYEIEYSISQAANLVDRDREHFTTMSRNCWKTKRLFGRMYERLKHKVENWIDRTKLRTTEQQYVDTHHSLSQNFSGSYLSGDVLRITVEIWRGQHDSIIFFRPTN